MTTPDEQPLCHLHQVPMSLQDVPIAYGALGPQDAPYFEAAAQYFPNYRAYVLGGCSPGITKSHTMWTCPACQEAEQVWQQSRK